MKYVTLLAALLISVNAFCQMSVLEKDYEISRKARNGFLGQIEKHPETNTFDLIYILKSSASKVKTEIYTYDKDLNLVGQKKEEEEIEKVRKKYKWFRYKGETYETQSVYVRANMTQQMVFRQKTIRYKWSWWRGGYAKRVILGDKVKPKNEEGNANLMFRGGYYENDSEGYLLVCAGVGAGKKDMTGSFLKYQIYKADKDVNMEKTAEINFDVANTPILSQPLEDDDPTTQDDAPRDWVLVFATYGGAGMKKVEGDPNSYTYCRLSPEGVLKEKVNFKVSVAGWRVLGAYEKDGQVYFYGPGIGKDKFSNEIFKGAILANTSNEDADTEKKGGFGALKGMISGEGFQVTQDAIDDRLDEMKYTNFQVGKIQNGNLVFANAPTVSDINDKNIKPEGQKKKVEFDGKRFLTTDLSVTSDNNMFISGQDYSIDKLGKNQGTKLYKGLFLLQYDGQGNFMRNYGVEVDQKKYMGMFSRGLTPNMYPVSSNIIESGDKKQLYWMMVICKAIDTDVDIDDQYNFFNGSTTRTTTTSFSPLLSIQYGSINKQDGKASEFKTLGEDEKRKFYLMSGVNRIRMNDYQIYLSETVKGDKILLSRFDVSH